VLKFRGLGVSFRAQTIRPEVVERPFDRLTVLSNVEGHLIFAYMAGSPTELVFLSDGPRMCLSGDPFVPKTGGGKGRGVLWV